MFRFCSFFVIATSLAVAATVSAQQQARISPHETISAVIDGDRRFTYAQFYERCRRFASMLVRHGVGRGDTVASILNLSSSAFTVVRSRCR